MLRASLCTPRHDPKCFINVNGLNLKPALIINPPGHIGKLRKRATKRLLPIDHHHGHHHGDSGDMETQPWGSWPYIIHCQGCPNTLEELEMSILLVIRPKTNLKLYQVSLAWS